MTPQETLQHSLERLELLMLSPQKAQEPRGWICLCPLEYFAGCTRKKQVNSGEKALKGEPVRALGLNTWQFLPVL